LPGVNHTVIEIIASVRKKHVVFAGDITDIDQAPRPTQV
jgi:hypothetical protein